MNAPTVIEPGDVSPWGTIETVTYYGDGITFVETKSHEGFHVDGALLYRVPMEWRTARRKGFTHQHCNWFEGEVDACMVVRTFPNLFTVSDRQWAREVFDEFIPAKMAKAAA